MTERLRVTSGDAARASEELQDSLRQASEDLRGRQQAAYAQAEETKAAAISEAAGIIARAKVEAEARLASADNEMAARNERLKREQRHLRQRKQALLSQLAQLSTLAIETAEEFPEDEATGPIPELVATTSTETSLEPIVLGEGIPAEGIAEGGTSPDTGEGDPAVVEVEGTVETWSDDTQEHPGS